MIRARANGKLRPLFLMAAACLASATVSPSADAQTPPTAEERAGARSAAEAGTKEYQAGHYAQALDLYTRAESLIHAPTHVLMMGRAQAQLGHLVQAYESFGKVTREELSDKAPPAFKKAQSDAAQELKALAPRLPQAQISVSDPSAKGLAVSMDGKPVSAALVGIPHPVDPGVHVFKATADGQASDEKSLTLKEGEKKDLKLDLHPVAADAVAPPPGPVSIAPPDAGKPDAPAPDQPAPQQGSSPLRNVGFGMVAVGAAGLIVGGVFTGLYASKRGAATDAFHACGPGCVGPQEDNVKALDNAANPKGTVAVIGLAAGGALAITGIALILTHPKAKAPTSAGVTPWIGAKQLGLSGSF